MKRKRANLPLTLPDELIEEILLRLPVKSLLRFKCVCTSWLSLISNPQFAKSHFDVAAAPTERLLLKFSKDSKASSIDIEAPLHGDSVEVVFNVPNPSPAPKHGCRVDVVGSCRGFLLITTAPAFSDFIYFAIWNPSTGLEKRFNKRFNQQLNDRFICGFGYDSSTDDYVVVTVTLLPPQRSGSLGTEVHFFSSRTNSWKCSEGTVPYRHMGQGFRHGLLLNGALHWLVRSYDHHRKIIAFDVIEKRLSEISLPHDLDVRLQTKIYNLRVIEGCLCLWFPGYDTAPAEMWTMKEYKVQSSWTYSFVLSRYCCSLRDLYFYPVCFTKKGEILGYDGRQTLVRLNDKSELLERRAQRRSKDRFDVLHCCMYTKSLLPLPGDFEKPSEDEQQQQTGRIN